MPTAVSLIGVASVLWSLVPAPAQAEEAAAASSGISALLEVRSTVARSSNRPAPGTTSIHFVGSAAAHPSGEHTVHSYTALYLTCEQQT